MPGNLASPWAIMLNANGWLFSSGRASKLEGSDMKHLESWLWLISVMGRAQICIYWISLPPSSSSLTRTHSTYLPYDERTLAGNGWGSRETEEHNQIPELEQLVMFAISIVLASSYCEMVKVCFVLVIINTGEVSIITLSRLQLIDVRFAWKSWCKKMRFQDLASISRSD